MIRLYLIYLYAIDKFLYVILFSRACSQIREATILFSWIDNSGSKTVL